MTDKPTPKPETDPDQSERFRKVVRELEAAGELNDTEGERALNGLLGESSALPAKQRHVP